MLAVVLRIIKVKMFFLKKIIHLFYNLNLILNNSVNIKLYIIRIKNYFTNNIHYCFMLPFILNLLGTETNSKPEPIIQLFGGIFILSALSFMSLINIMFYLASLYFIKNNK